MRIEAIAWFDMPNKGKWHGQNVMPQQELIRCKDCIRWRRSKSDTTAMVCDWDRYERTENDFCSWAKRKDDDTD